MTIFAGSSSKTTGADTLLPPVSPYVRKRDSIFRKDNKSKGAKGSLKTSNFECPNLNDYKVVVVDPGTSSMGVRSVRRKNGKTKEVFRWETKSFKTDSSLLQQVQMYILEVFDCEPDLVVIELQLSRFGVEYTQHTVINICVTYNIPIVVLQPLTRYWTFNVPYRTLGPTKSKKMICEIGNKILTEEDDETSLDMLKNVKGLVSKNDTKVSAAKQRSDMLDGISLLICAETLLIQACEEVVSVESELNELQL
jgi:hypothetical protein